MASEGVRGAGASGERVTRGFEDLVREESLLPATQGPLSPSQELERVDSLEHRVRITMDRLTELVEAQLPEAVDGLRADVDQLRTELRQALADASTALAEERYQLRSQIATTVGAANRWFVRTRDQLFERLDQVTQIATAAQAEAEAAASAAVAAAVPTPTEPEILVEEQVEEQIEEQVEEQGEQPEELAELEWDAGDLTGEDQSAILAEGDGGGGEAPELELAPDYDYELEQPPSAPTTVEVNLDAPELDALLEPLRDDLRELQGEISAMGAAVIALRDDLEELGSRIPRRASSPRLTPTQLNAIVAAVQSAFPAPPAPRRSSPSTKKKATTRTAPAKRAAAKKGTTAKRATSSRSTVPASRRRTPPR